MISFSPPQTTARCNRQELVDMRELLARAKVILSRWDRLHQLSVDIGRFEKISDSGVIDSEMNACRRIIEQADRLCADIDRLNSRQPFQKDTQ